MSRNLSIVRAENRTLADRVGRILGNILPGVKKSVAEAFSLKDLEPVYDLIHKPLDLTPFLINMASDEDFERYGFREVPALASETVKVYVPSSQPCPKALPSGSKTGFDDIFERVTKDTREVVYAEK